MSKKTLISVNTSKYINDSSREYSIYTCEARAIASVTDGLKPSQRKALYVAMNKPEKIKTVSLSGMTIAQGLYVHGDVSLSDTISKLAGKYVNNVPLLKGTGCFGTKVSPNASAAPRYTYVQKYNNTEELIYQDKGIVPYIDNYDGSAKEPLHFLPLIPIVLLNGIAGIAVGWSCEILPHNIKDLIKATRNVLLGRKVGKLIPTYSHCDHDTTDLGDGKWIFYGKFERLDLSTIRLTSLPPEMSLERINDILSILDDKGIIRDYTDNSSSSIDIEVKFPRGELKSLSDSDILSLLKLHTKKTQRLVTLDFNHDGIRQFDTVEQLITEFVDFRFNFYIKRYEKYLKDDSYELNYWLALKICFDSNLVDFIKDIESKKMMIDFIDGLTVSASPDEHQIEKIAVLPAYQFTIEFRKKCIQKIKELKGSIKQHNAMLADHSLIKQEYINEIDQLSKIKFDIKR